MADAAHWDDAYGRLGTEGVSWYRVQQQPSLDLLEAIGAPPSSVADIGGGASTLVDQLLDRGVADITVTDISQNGLDAARTRLGPRGASVNWVLGDVRAWHPGRTFDVWHDRAVFHFMVTPDDRVAYRRALAEGLAPGGHAICATFAADGPDECSRLPVERYGPDALVAALGDGLELVAHRREVHVTPSGREQPFTWVLARRHG